MKRKRICVITGGRQDYSYLYWLMKKIDCDPALNLQVIATAMHLSKKHGMTYKTILADGFKIDAKVALLGRDDSDFGMLNAISKGCRLFSEAFNDLAPDLIVILGDRFESFAAATAAYVLKNPIAHIHGGEVTEGAIDEAFRHSISKMSSIHFAATEIYRKRIIQMGEEPKRVFCCGTLSLEALKHEKIISFEELKKDLNLQGVGPWAIVTYHPETLDKEFGLKRLQCVLRAIKKSSLNVVFTKANADAQGDAVNHSIFKFCQKNPSRYYFVDYLGRQRYFSCLSHFDLMIGNSSSGIIEAPSFRLPFVNVGSRQGGRIRSKNIIDVNYSEEKISKAIDKSLSLSFKKGLENMKNVYAPEGTNPATLILKYLKKYLLSSVTIQKKFYDIKFKLHK